MASKLGKSSSYYTVGLTPNDRISGGMTGSLLSFCSDAADVDYLYLDHASDVSGGASPGGSDVSLKSSVKAALFIADISPSANGQRNKGEVLSCLFELRM